jgi:hypothetical protein
MTADYNGWNDAPEAEREAIDEYTRQEVEREGIAELAKLQQADLQLRTYASEFGAALAEMIGLFTW